MITLTYNGVDLAQEYSCSIFRTDSDTSPAREMEFVSIPGRSGRLILDKDKYGDVDMIYSAVFYNENADSNAINMKNFLLSQVGYQRLTDSEHPDEFYLAVVSKKIKPVITEQRDSVKMEITFSRKPQRYLLSGETVYNWLNQEITGSVLTLDATKVASNYLMWNYNAHAVEISSGAGGGQGYTVQVRSRQNIMIYYLDQNGVEDTSKRYSSGNFAGSYPLTQATANCITGSVTIYAERHTYIELTNKTVYSANDHIFRTTIPSGSSWSTINVATRTYQSHGATPPTDYEYAVKTSVSALTESPYSICLSGSYIYIRDIGCSTVDDLVTRLTNCQFDVTLTTPKTVSITPYVPQFQSSGFFTLKGMDTIRGSDVAYETFTARYVASDSMSNPTDFTSAPIIRAYGNGVFEMDGVTITITGATQYTDIDCDLMDCYEGSTNRNNDVTFSTYNFPMLRTGANTIEITSGISALEIQPRWWRL